jgi:cellulose synthase (UDP-forming)
MNASSGGSRKPPGQADQRPPMSSPSGPDRRSGGIAGAWVGIPHGGRWYDKLAFAVVAVVGASLMVLLATVPLDAREQAVLAVCGAVVFLLGNRIKGTPASVFLVALSLGISLRYIIWRVTQTLDFASTFELFLGAILATAELYAITVLVLGYIQNLWPLHRKPMPLPDDPETWPNVDIYIPTYNEPMSIVRATVLGAMNIDWPPEKLNVYLLDDGKREEFRVFAQQCGIGYITRTNNAHAKAGNLNHAMTVTTGEFIAIFDCDHIPTRSFLQLTLGWMVAQPRNALIQTPHHFYSPDPFQRNLTAGTRVPAEGNMFYGLIQDGNDYWNATFFCGSCAVVRRAALQEIGGFAVETVTEDAHTMLKLHRRGWDSAYLRIPLAAGLATERLALHIGQRIRWARGMIQIFRLDCPLFGPGLTWGQRVCYVQAMGHFFFAVPRVIFLTSPLAYLLLNQNIIAASPLAIISYALPHIFHSVATNSRLQKNWRHSFWSEIYETVMALFLVRVTLVTIVTPKRGKFNVTAKGGLLENGYFDLRAVYPNLILAFFLLAGVVRGVLTMILVHTERLVFQALLLNTIWAVFSLLIVMAALAVGRERRQIRSRHRIRAELQVAIYLPDGRVIMGRTRDLSQGGSFIDATAMEDVPRGTPCQLEFAIGNEMPMLPSQILRWEGRSLQVRFQPASIADEAAIIAVVFGRPDAWNDWANYRNDQPMVSLWRVLVSIKGLFRPRDPSAKRTAGVPQVPDAQPVIDLNTGAVVATGAPRLPVPAAANRAVRSPASTAATLAMTAGAALAALLAMANPAVAQQLAAPPRATVPAINPGGTPGGLTIRPVPGSSPYQTTSQPVQPINPLPAYVPGTPGLASPAAPAAYTAPGQPSPSSFANGPANGGAAAAHTRHVVFTLHQLGAQGPLTLRGTSELQGIQFGIRADEVVTAAELTMSGAMSPALIPEFSNDTITLNEQYVGTIPVNRDAPRFDNLTFPVSPVFFQDNNRLNVRFTGRYTTECNDPLSGLLWSNISDTSTLAMTLERLPPQRDLARLPLPFFDPREKQMLNLPFVLAATASPDALQAAGAVASWFGLLADYRSATFPVVTEAPPDGNAVVIVVGAERGGNLNLPPINGPTLAVIANPNDPTSSLLVVAGRTGEEVATAAQALTLGSRALGGDNVAVTKPDVPKRKPYDAPYWIASDRPVKFGELVDAADLQGYGYVPGTLRVPFRTAPDLYTWRNRPFVSDVRFRSPPGPIMDVAVSRLDVGINNLFLTSFPFALDDTGLFSRMFNFWNQPHTYRVDVPVYDVFGQNDLQFFFDARPLHRGDCVAVPSDLHMVINPDSTIDISRAYHFTELPNLAFFVNSAFPFTRMADLSETAVVLSDKPTPIELSAYLNLMGRIGSLTGYPTIGVTVVRPDNLAAAADKDILVLGTLGHLGAAADLLRNSPVRISGNTMAVELGSTLDSVRRIFGDTVTDQRAKASATLTSVPTEGSAFLVGAQSPLTKKRSVVAFLASAPAGLNNMVSTLRDTDQAPLIQGDLTVLSADRVTSYRVGSVYTVGYLAPWVWVSYMLGDQPLVIMLGMIFAAMIIGSVLYWALRRGMRSRMARMTGTAHE